MGNRSFAKGMVAGAVGGALGTLALNVFQQASIGATRALERSPEQPGSVTQQQEQLLKSFEVAHRRTANGLAETAGSHLTPSQHANSAPVVEFAFGILCAAVYGALAEYLPAVTAGFGGVYGSVLFAGASEAVLPAMGFVAMPGERTPVQHAGGLSGNVVYGVCTEGVRRLLRS